MIVGPTTVPTALAASPARTEAVAPLMPAVALPAASSQPQTLRAAIPVTAGSPRSAADDARTRVAIQQQQARDRDLRPHEQARTATAGSSAASAPRYSYITGSDGRRYAIGGTVENNEPRSEPDADADEGQFAEAAALGSTQPWSADLAMAKLGARIEQRARAEIALRGQAASAYAGGGIGALGSAPGRVIESSA